MRSIRVFVSALVMLSYSVMAETTILNASYDPTREFYQSFNAAFAKHWLEKNGEEITIHQSHAGSGKQARSVIDGLDADVVTLALAYDIDVMADKGLLDVNWQQKLPHNASPYYSTIVFLVRKGNPKNIKDWSDLIKPGVEVITANPKSSGGARWTYLAAWAYAMALPQSDEQSAKTFVSKLYGNVKVLDSAARGATTTFVERGMGDVLLSWENEAHLALRENGQAEFEMVIPSLSILAEPPVSVVDKVAKKRGTQALAQAYLEYLYTPVGQTLVAENFYRPTDADVARVFASRFPKLKLVSIKEAFGDWRKAQQLHFADGGFFDQMTMSMGLQ